MKIFYQAESYVGKIRNNNQDNFYVNGIIKNMDADVASYSEESDQQYHLLAVCDGMGGEEQGEMAAYLAVECLRRYDSASFESRWMEYIEEVNEIICQYQTMNSIKMGTTFAGIFINSSRLISINIGDSRIYRIRGNKIWQISKDHNQYQAMMEAGMIVDEHIIRRSKSRLTQCLGIRPERFKIEPHTVYVDDILSGDIYLLCSDGIHGALSDSQIVQITAGIKKEENGIASSLIRNAELFGSRDNLTAVVVYIKETGRRETIRHKMAKRLFHGKKE